MTIDYTYLSFCCFCFGASSFFALNPDRACGVDPSGQFANQMTAPGAGSTVTGPLFGLAHKKYSLFLLSDTL
jgi:hypothetical protein